MEDPDTRLKPYAHVWNYRRHVRLRLAEFVGRPSEQAFDVLSEKFNGGTFNVIVRRGETMELSEIVHLASRLDRMAVFEVHRARYG